MVAAATGAVAVVSVANDLAEGEGLAWLVVAGIVLFTVYEIYTYLENNTPPGGSLPETAGQVAGSSITDAVAGGTEGLFGLPSGALDSWSNLWGAFTGSYTGPNPGG